MSNSMFDELKEIKYFKKQQLQEPCRDVLQCKIL